MSMGLKYHLKGKRVNTGSFSPKRFVSRSLGENCLVKKNRIHYIKVSRYCSPFNDGQIQVMRMGQIMTQEIGHFRTKFGRWLPWRVGLLVILLLLPSPAWAFIPHWDPQEAFFIRQFAYLFWALSMVFFIFALKQEKLHEHPGFRRLVWAGVFFALWNFDCFIGQFISLSRESAETTGLLAAATRELSGSKVLNWFYYLTKLDHLLLVPAFLFYYLGIRAFCRSPEV
jgi:hypothetical protein